MPLFSVHVLRKASLKSVALMMHTMITNLQMLLKSRMLTGLKKVCVALSLHFTLQPHSVDLAQHGQHAQLTQGQQHHTQRDLHDTTANHFIHWDKPHGHLAIFHVLPPPH